MTKKRRISLALLSTLLSAVLLLSGVMIWQEFSDRQKEKAAFDTLAELVASEESGPQKNAEESENPDRQADDTQADAADVPVRTRNLAPLFEKNRDCVGWICIPGTAVDYPVMHTPEQPQKYLRLDFYGQYSVSGVPFVEGRCSLDGEHLIIYGHNMKNGTMFGSLKQYTDRDYLTAHPTVEFETASGCVRYEVFAVAVVNKYDDWYSFTGAAGEAAYQEQISHIRDKALLKTEVMPVYGGQLLTLSTCYGSGSDHRLLVIAAETTADG